MNLKFGISDFALLCFGTGPISSVNFALTQLPTLVMFQRLTPPNVEATMMAFAASFVNMSRGLIPDMMGVFINKNFVGVTENDLSKYYILSLISIISTLYEIILIRLIPLRSELS